MREGDICAPGNARRRRGVRGYFSRAEEATRGHAHGRPQHAAVGVGHGEQRKDAAQDTSRDGELDAAAVPTLTADARQKLVKAGLVLQRVMQTKVDVQCADREQVQLDGCVSQAAGRERGVQAERVLPCGQGVADASVCAEGEKRALSGAVVCSRRGCDAEVEQPLSAAQQRRVGSGEGAVGEGAAVGCNERKRLICKRDRASARTLSAPGR